jgi:hypothetical protein
MECKVTMDMAGGDDHLNWVMVTRACISGTSTAITTDCSFFKNIDRDVICSTVRVLLAC